MRSPTNHTLICNKNGCLVENSAVQGDGSVQELSRSKEMFQMIPLALPAKAAPGLKEMAPKGRSGLADTDTVTAHWIERKASPSSKCIMRGQYEDPSEVEQGQVTGQFDDLADQEDEEDSDDDDELGALIYRESRVGKARAAAAEEVVLGSIPTLPLENHILLKETDAASASPTLETPAYMNSSPSPRNWDGLLDRKARATIDPSSHDRSCCNGSVSSVSLASAYTNTNGDAWRGTTPAALPTSRFADAGISNMNHGSSTQFHAAFLESGSVAKAENPTESGPHQVSVASYHPTSPTLNVSLFYEALKFSQQQEQYEMQLATQRARGDELQKKSNWQQREIEHLKNLLNQQKELAKDKVVHIQTMENENGGVERRKEMEEVTAIEDGTGSKAAG